MAKLAFNDIAESPLAKADVEPEEAALWLDMHGLMDFKGLKCLFNLIQRYYHTDADWSLSRMPFRSAFFQPIGNLLSVELYYVTDIVLKNVFTVMFKLGNLKRDDAKKLLKYADEQFKKLNARCKKLKHDEIVSARLRQGMPTIKDNGFKRMSDLSEVYGELLDRLKDLESTLSDT